jgi:predicted outer membrane repeat protein
MCTTVSTTDIGRKSSSATAKSCDPSGDQISSHTSRLHGGCMVLVVGVCPSSALHVGCLICETAFKIFFAFLAIFIELSRSLYMQCRWVLAWSILAVNVQAQSCSKQPASIKVSSRSGLSALVEALANAESCPNAKINAVWEGTVKLSEYIYVNKGTSLTVIGENVATAIADGGGKSQLFAVYGDLVLINMTLSKGFSDSFGGGAVSLGEFGSLTASGSVFRSNTVGGSSGYGGAVFGSLNSTISINKSTFTINTASVAGGAIASQAGVHITNSVFDNNAVRGDAAYGGAVWGDTNSTISINNSIFTKNTASLSGGALFTAAGVEAGLNITNCVFDSNAACVSDAIMIDCKGGGAAAYTAYAAISDSSFTNNSVILADISASNSGGAALVDLSVFDQTTEVTADNAGIILGLTIIERSTFTDNSASDKAGAAFCKGNVTLNECIFRGNSALDAGAVYLDSGLISISQCTFADNTANGDDVTRGNGGAIYLSALSPESTCLINASTFINNICQSSGAAIFSDIPLDVRFSNFSSNTAVYSGGAISASFLEIETCAFTSNRATLGGAIESKGERLNVFRSVLNNNTASSGGAIHTKGSCSLYNTTLINNTALSQGNTRL